MVSVLLDPQIVDDIALKWDDPDRLLFPDPVGNWVDGFQVSRACWGAVTVTTGASGLLTVPAADDLCVTVTVWAGALADLTVTNPVIQPGTVWMVNISADGELTVIGRYGTDETPPTARME